MKMKHTFETIKQPALSIHITFQREPGPHFSSQHLMPSQPLEHFSALTGRRPALTRRWKHFSVCRNSPHSDGPDPGSASAAPDPLNNNKKKISRQTLRITDRDRKLTNSHVNPAKNCYCNICFNINPWQRKKSLKKSRHNKGKQNRSHSAVIMYII